MVAAAVALPASLISWAMWPDHDSPSVRVAVIDQTGYTTSSANDRETAARMTEVINETAAERGRLFIVPIGADATAAAVLHAFDFDPPCPNDRLCETEREQIAEGAADAVEVLINDNEGADSTDVMSAFRTAISVCRQRPEADCSLHVMSDGVQNTAELSLLVEVPVDDAQAIAEIHLDGGIVGDMSGIDLDWSGIGTDGSTADRAADLITFWTAYLTSIGADQPVVARTITN